MRSGLMLYQVKFRLDIQEKFLHRKSMEYWKRLPRKVVHQFEVFGRHTKDDVVLRDVVWWWSCQWKFHTWI